MAQLMFDSQELQEVNVNQQGSLIAQQAAQNITTKAKGKGSILETINIAGQAAVSINRINRENEVRVQREKVKYVQGEYLDTINTPAYLEGSTTQRIEILSGFNQKMSTDSDVAGSAAVEYSSAKMGSLWNSKNKEQDTTDLEGSFNAYTVRKEDTSFRGFVDEYSTLFPRLSKKDIRDNTFFGVSMQGNSYIAEAPNTPEGLQEALTNVEDLEQDSKDNWKIGTSETINKARRLREKAISDKQANIVLTAKKGLAQVADGGNIEDVSRVNTLIDSAFSDPITNQTKKAQYKKDYDNTIEYNEWSSNNPVGESKISPAPSDNPLYKKNRQRETTDALVQSFQDGQPIRTSEIAINEPSFVKPFGEFILGNINSTSSSEELLSLATYVNQLEPTVARSMFSDSQYNQIMALEGLAIAYPDKSLVDIRGMIQQASGVVGAGKMSPNDTADMLEIANDFPIGIGNRYRSSIQHLEKIDAGMAEKRYKDIAKNFSGLVIENEEGIQVDQSLAIQKEALDNSDRDIKIKDSSPVGTESMMNLTPTTVVYKDKDGWNISISNIDYIIEDSDFDVTQKILDEKKYTKEALTGSKGILTGVAVGSKQAVKSALRDSTDGFLNAVTAVPRVLGELTGTLASRFVGHLWDSMTTGQQEFFTIDRTDDPIQQEAFERRQAKEFDIEGKRIPTEEAKNAAALEALEVTRSKYDIEGKLKDIDLSTLSEQDRVSLPYAIASNNKTLNQIDGMIQEIRTLHGGAAIKAVEAKEGTLNEVQKYVVEDEGFSANEYLDTKGISTGGVGQTGEFKGKSFKEVFDIKEKELSTIIPAYDSLSTDKQKALMSLMYRGDIKRSYKWVQAFNRGDDISGVITEYFNNREFDTTNSRTKNRGVADRLIRNAELLL